MKKPASLRGEPGFRAALPRAGERPHTDVRPGKVRMHALLAAHKEKPRIAAGFFLSRMARGV
jgi:hypothetical protein